MKTTTIEVGQLVAALSAKGIERQMAAVPAGRHIEVNLSPAVQPCTTNRSTQCASARLTAADIAAASLCQLISAMRPITSRGHHVMSRPTLVRISRPLLAMAGGGSVNERAPMGEGAGLPGFSSRYFTRTSQHE